MSSLFQDETKYHSSESLLNKYNIPITFLDFGYVGKCTDGNELEKILHILQSGQEGHFPELIRATEERLLKFKPKSKFLRKKNKVIDKCEIEKDEWKQLSDDLNKWVNHIGKNNQELETRKISKSPLNIPDVRKEEKHVNDIKPQVKEEKRIKSTDYDSWDKYDPDTEILKMDLKDEKIKKDAMAKPKPNKPKKTVKFNIFATEAEAAFEANREREKGNECFKAKEYDKAIDHYTISLECKKTTQCFNNRALTFIKKQQFENAIMDCDSALLIEPDNFKSLIRKAVALEELKQYDEAFEYADQCVKINPNDIDAQNICSRLGKHYKKELTNTRFKIEEVETNSKEKTDEVRSTDLNKSIKIIDNKKNKKAAETNSEKIIPIPGTSKMPPPYYTSYSNSPELNDKKVSKVDNNSKSNAIPLKQKDNDSYNTNETNLDKKGTISIAKFQIKEEESLRLKGPKDFSMEKYNKHSSTASNKKTNTATRAQENDKIAGGEPFLNENDLNLTFDLNQPYNFLKAWASVGRDESLKKFADILRNLNIDNMNRIIGNKMDNNMFSKIVKCLCMHFTVPSEVNWLFKIMIEMSNLPRFDILMMLISAEDRRFINIIIEFLKQHDKNLPEDVLSKYN